MAGIAADRNPAADGTGQQSGYTGSVLRQGICLLRFRLTSKASPLEQRSNALVDEGPQVEDVLVLRRGQLMKLRTAIVTGRMNAIDHH